VHLYDYWESGNGYKVRMLLHRLGQPFERTELDILDGETRTPEFLAKNPNGRIPYLVLDDGSGLAESGAILWYLAEGSSWLPEDRLARAQMLQWMFFEQYSHEPFIAVLRFWNFANKLGEHTADEIAAKRAGGHAALTVMEEHLGSRDFFVGEHESLADLALYAYTHVANEGGFELDDYPAVGSWLARVAAAGGHVPITEVGGLGRR
jgi:glutathione S-transferase